MAEQLSQQRKVAIAIAATAAAALPTSLFCGPARKVPVRSSHRPSRSPLSSGWQRQENGLSQRDAGGADAQPELIHQEADGQAPHLRKQHPSAGGRFDEKQGHKWILSRALVEPS